MKKTIESKAAATILQRPNEITVGNKTYQVAPPSPATLILVSELVSQMPQINLDESDIISESLRVAKDCRVIGDIIAVLILGAQNLLQTKRVIKRVWLIFPKYETIIVDRQKELATEVLYDLRPIELNAIVQKLMVMMELSFFFSLTTFLIGINLLKVTKDPGTTQSGQ